MTHAHRDEADLLQRQSLKHKVLRQPLEEAEKLASAGASLLKAALEEKDPIQKERDIRAAAGFLSRAKRGARGLLKDSKDDE